MSGVTDRRSPPELMFWNAARGVLPGLARQVWVNCYRVDFAIQSRQIAIEIDGAAFHASPVNREHDYRKDRRLTADGWRVIRFSAAEVVRDPYNCVLQVRTIIQALDRTKPEDVCQTR